MEHDTFSNVFLYSGALYALDSSSINIDGNILFADNFATNDGGENRR